MSSFYLNGEMTLRRTFSLPVLAAAAAGLMLLVSGAARAADTVSYQSAPLVASGDRAGNLQIPANYDLYVGGLTDTGQIVFSAGRYSSQPELLLQWNGESISTIVAPASGPVGAYPGDVYWPKDVTIDRPVGMNQRGDVVFSTDHTGGYNPWGTFLWNATTQRVTPIALKDMMATGNLTFVKPGSFGPAINNHGEIAFAGQVRGPNGPNGWGLFVRAVDGDLHPICLPSQSLPSADGHAKAATDEYFLPSLNDLGQIAFVTQRSGQFGHSAYRWQNGDLQALVLVGQTTDSGAKITDIASASINDRDGSTLVAATTDKSGGHIGLYRVRDGGVRADVVPGMPMPGGGILRTVQYSYQQEFATPQVALSAPNAAGQCAFEATLMDGSAAAYRLDPNGALTMIFQAIPPTAGVHIQEVGANMRFVPGSRPALNNKGRVALSVRLADGHSLIVLLRPVSRS